MSLSLEDLHNGNVSLTCDHRGASIFVRSSMDVKLYKIMFFSISAVSILQALLLALQHSSSCDIFG